MNKDFHTQSELKTRHRHLKAIRAIARALDLLVPVKAVVVLVGVKQGRVNLEVQVRKVQSHLGHTVGKEAKMMILLSSLPVDLMVIHMLQRILREEEKAA